MHSYYNQIKEENHSIYYIQTMAYSACSFVAILYSARICTCKCCHCVLHINANATVCINVATVSLCINVASDMCNCRLHCV